MVEICLGLVKFWIGSDREREEVLNSAQEVSLPLKVITLL